MRSLKFDLWKGDCLERMKEIPDGSVDCVITDPPFQVTQCKWDKIIPFEPMWAELKRIIKPNGAILLFGVEPYSSALRMSNLKMFKYDLIWDKKSTTGFLNANKMPLRQHENIHLFYNKPPTYNPQMRKGKKRTKGGKQYTKSPVYGDYNELPKIEYDLYHPTTIKTFSNAHQKGKLHPTQKPVALLEYLIKTYTHEGETVLDFTAGSFSTAIACLNTDRNFIGIELDDNYFGIGVNRIKGHIENNGMNVELEIKE